MSTRLLPNYRRYYNNILYDSLSKLSRARELADKLVKF